MPRPSPSPLLERIAQVVRAIPKGQVLAYSRVALLAGIPGAARRVGKAMAELEGVPWWRVVRADLTLAEEVAFEQARRLTAEGVAVRGRKVAAAARASLAEVEQRLSRGR